MTPLPQVSPRQLDPATQHSEGDTNRSDRRSEWQAGALDDRARRLLDEDSRYFLHQSLSIYVTDVQGRRYMDFHGNNVHQVGFAHPEVMAAIRRQLDELSCCTRRYTNQVAVDVARKLTEIAPGNLNKVLFCPGGTEAIGIALKRAGAHAWRGTGKESTDARTGDRRGGAGDVPGA